MNADERRFSTISSASPNRRLSASIGGLVLLAGCSGYTGPRSVMNEDPAVKIPEIHKAIQQGDMSVLPQLVEDLDSDDSAVRLHAIGGLRKLTGQSFDYNWTEEDRAERRASIEKWEAYVRTGELPSEGK